MGDRQAAPIECVPSIMDFDLLPDMGQNDRAIALGRRAWLFAGSRRGGERAAAMYTLIGTAKLTGVDPQAWLADMLRRIAAFAGRGRTEVRGSSC